jgi:hypothetical protein
MCISVHTTNSILAGEWYDFQSQKISWEKSDGELDRFHGACSRGAITEGLERGGDQADQSCFHRDKPGGEQNEPGGGSARYYGVHPRGAITEGLEGDLANVIGVVTDWTCCERRGSEREGGASPAASPSGACEREIGSTVHLLPV